LNARLHSHFPVAATAAFLIALVAALSSQPAPAPSLSLLSKDGRRALPLALVADQEFVALDDLAAAFQLTVREESLGAVTVSYKGKTVVLTPDQALASVSGRLVSLPAPPTRNGRRWLVPVEFVSRALSLIYDQRLDLRKPARLLVIGDLRVPRITVRYDPLGAAGRLTIDATPRAAATITQEAEHLTIKFDADALDAANPPLPPSPAPGLILGVRLVDATTMAVDLGPRFAGFRATTQPSDTTMRVVIDVVAAQTDAAPAPAAIPAQPPPDLPPSFGQSGSPFRTIAIDPGHGGDDGGVKSGDGAREKDLTLALARRIKATIEARLGLRVLLTRDDDRSVPVDERTSIANNNKADLFISLHANGSLRASASGAAIYLAAFDRDAAQAAAGGAERVPAFGGGSRDIEMVPWDLAQTRHLDQSAAFADLLQQTLHDHVAMSARPIDRAPLRVLESANMPAVLLEVGYLTNAEQARQLAGDGWQNGLVQGVFDAIVKYRDALPGGGIR
jgi:N-acetylmuramoyl-L-alanine amidase